MFRSSSSGRPNYRLLRVSKNRLAQRFTKSPKLTVPRFSTSFLLKQIQAALSLMQEAQNNYIFTQRRGKAARFFKEVFMMGTPVGALAYTATQTGLNLYHMTSNRLATYSHYQHEQDRLDTLWRNTLVTDHPNWTCEEIYDKNCNAIYDIDTTCEKILHDMCENEEEYDNWAGSNDYINDWQGLVFLILTLTLLLAAVAMIVWRVSVLRQQPSAQLTDPLSWESSLSTENKIICAQFIEKLEHLTGMPAPTTRIELMTYLKQIARALKRYEEGCHSLFYLLENKSLNTDGSEKNDDIYKFYREARESFIPKIILDQLAEMAITDLKQEAEEQTPLLSIRIGQ